MKNVGKIFEESFRKSIPSSSLLIRLNDAPQAFSKSNLTKFTRRNPCDFILFDCLHKILIPIELKTTKYKSISFEDANGDNNQNKMIHKHQIVGLTEFSKYNCVIPGFLFNFRDEKNNCERCYFQRINDFNTMVESIDKKSFNELDLLTCGNAIKLQGELKRTRYRWDVFKMLDDIYNKFWLCHNK